MSRIYYFPKLGTKRADIVQVQSFLREIGHSVEVPSSAEEGFGALWAAPLGDDVAYALQGWQSRIMNWADTVIISAPASPGTHMVAGHFVGQGKRAILFHHGWTPTNADLLFTEHAASMDDLLELIGGREKI